MPEPWTEVAQIPWDDPEFSRRMLREHLTQDHDAASRRSAIIDEHVDWIHRTHLQAAQSRILDLGCGPGLYCSRLAALGHSCTGIDFGPASITHARQQAERDGHASEYVLGNILETPFGKAHDLVMLLFGEFNVFRRADALDILKRGNQALAPGGAMVIEAHTFESIHRRKDEPTTWKSYDHGLFSDEPYIQLNETSWNDDSATAIARHYVIDVTTGEVERFGTTTQAYTRGEYEALISEAGFSRIEWPDDWPDPAQHGDFELIVARV